MFVERYGKGTTHLLCLHGWSGDHRTFAPLAAALPADLSLWCPDLPGCGASNPPRDWSLSSIADELAEYAATFPGPLRIIGNCSGAILALEIARRVPVSRIVMIDAFAYWPSYFKVFLAPGWGHYAYYTAFANPVGRWLANRSLSKHRTESTDLTDGFSRVNHEVTLKYLHVLNEVNSIDRYRNIGASIDLAYGERSFDAIRRSVAMWQGIFPGARTFELKGAGHLPLLEATSQLHEIVFEEERCLTASMNSAR